MGAAGTTTSTAAPCNSSDQTTMTSHIDIEGYRIPAEIVSEEAEVSPRTGRELRRITVRVSHDSDRVHDELIAADEGDLRVQLIRDGEQDGESWAASIPQWSSSSRNAGPTTYRYSIELTEMEEYAVETLSIEDLEFDVVTYDESLTDQSLSLTFVAPITEEDLDRFIELWREPGTYFDVVRHGIDKEPRSMRFGLCLWSEHENGPKVRATLVDASYDEEGLGSKFVALSNVTGPNVRTTLAQYGAMFDQLLRTLRRKGVLTEDEVDEVVGAKEVDLSQQLFRFYCVENVEALGFDDV